MDNFLPYIVNISKYVRSCVLSHIVLPRSAAMKDTDPNKRNNMIGGDERTRQAKTPESQSQPRISVEKEILFCIAGGIQWVDLGRVLVCGRHAIFFWVVCGGQTFRYSV